MKDAYDNETLISEQFNLRITNFMSKIITSCLWLSFSLTLLSSSIVHAALVTITFEEVGANVVVSGQGSFDLTGLVDPTDFSQGGLVSYIQNDTSSVQFGGSGPSGLVDDYLISDPSTLPMFGVGGFTVADSEDGDVFAIVNAFDGKAVLFVAAGYESGTELTASMQFNNQSFSSLGITPSSSYVLTFGQNTVNYIVGNATPSTPVSAPVTLALFGLGIAGIVSRRRRI
jgi:hypothetical protein